MNDGNRLVATGPCWSCGRPFTLTPTWSHRSRSIPRRICRLTWEPKAGGYDRSVSQPICRSCVLMASRRRVAEGKSTSRRPAGAYPNQEVAGPGASSSTL